ncbi:hypothetical protein SLS55_002292 [Diplodia seriata]|uniref:Glycosyltransferase family 28 N-terminal domain-containing protein n=1 Tax=Diplodia seriata TaxID=420778 RepID=A0ABR3CRT4_9PEZI
MNIAILITGSRGDVQPFLALSKVLQSPPYCHRVRIVTHPNFKGFVEENGAELYSMGGDPEKLMAYMVRNPSILPSMASMKAGDVGMRRREIAEMLFGAWRGCTEAGDGIEDPKDDDIPFVADAIIANPPSYAHIHIAEKLSVPLHIMFTMPWSPTTAFPHPLANVQSSKSSNKVANWTSYYEMDLLTWEGLGDLINRFRVRTLDLDPLSPEAVHFKKLTAEKLAQNITEALKPEMQVRAKELAAKIRGERGAEKAAETFQSMPQMRGMACALCPDRVAVWKVRQTGIQLSAAAATVLVAKGLVDPHDLKL